MANVAGLDSNSRRTLSALSSDGSGTVVNLYADPTTHRLLVDNVGGQLTVGTTVISGGTNGYVLYDNNGVLGEEPAGLGTVTSVSVVSANGLAGTVATATTTPAITLSTTVNAPVLAGNGTAISAATTTGSGSTVALATSPTFQTSINGAYLDNSEILGTDGSKNIVSLPVATYPSLTELSYVKGVTSAIQNQINAKGSGTVTAVSVATANGVSGSSSGGAMPALTISLGAITPSTVNGNTITTGTGTLTLGAGKTLTANNSITLAGTDSTTMTFPTTSASIARTDAAQTFTGTQTFSQTILTANAITASGNAATVPVTSGRNIVTNNSAATLTITMTTTSAVNMQTCIVQILDFSAVAQTITWVNTENSTVTAPTTSNGSTTLPLTVGFIYNSGTSKWRCIASA